VRPYYTVKGYLHTHHVSLASLLLCLMPLFARSKATLTLDPPPNLGFIGKPVAPMSHPSAGPSVRDPGPHPQAQESTAMAKVLYGSSIDYLERQKRLRLLPPSPPAALNPFNSPTVNALESMFDRVLALAKGATAERTPATSKRGRFAPTRPVRGYIKPEEQDTIPHHQPPESPGEASVARDTQIPRSIWSTLSTTSFPSQKETQSYAYHYMLPPADGVTIEAEETDRRPKGKDDAEL